MFATPSNCGDPLKLHLPSCIGNVAVAELIALGMVKTVKMEQWAIRSQVLSRFVMIDMDAVHRLNGGGWEEKTLSA